MSSSISDSKQRQSLLMEDPSLQSLDSYSIQEAACTTTSVIFSLCLTIFTLSALHQGVQNIPLNSLKQEVLRNQLFFCIMIPMVIIYFSKLSMYEGVQ